MKRRWTGICALALCAALAVTFFPSAAYAAEEQPQAKEVKAQEVAEMNASFDAESGMLTWDEVEEAAAYKWSVEITGDDSNIHGYIVTGTTANVYKELDELATKGFSSADGKYMLTLGAYPDEEGNDEDLMAEFSTEITYHPQTIPEMDVTISNDGMASWEAVQDADYYYVLVDGNGGSIYDMELDIKRYIDTLIKKGDMENETTSWPIRIEAFSEDNELLAYYNTTFEYQSESTKVEVGHLDVTVDKTQITCQEVTNCASYYLEYDYADEFYHSDAYADSVFDCQNFLNRLYDGYGDALIEDGENVELNVYARDEDGVILAKGTVVVAFDAANSGYDPGGDEQQEFNAGWFGSYCTVFGGGYDQAYFNAGQNPKDRLVFRWTIANNGLNGEETDISYDDFMAMADKTFTTHSDLKAYLADEENAQEDGFTYNADTGMIHLSGETVHGGDSINLEVDDDNTVDGTGNLYSTWLEEYYNKGNVVIELKEGAIKRFVPSYEMMGAKSYAAEEGKTVTLTVPEVRTFDNKPVDLSDYTVKWYRGTLDKDGEFTGVDVVGSGTSCDINVLPGKESY